MDNNQKGFSPRALIITFLSLGALAGGFLGSRIDHAPIFTGLWGGMLGAFGAFAGMLIGYWLSRYL